MWFLRLSQSSPLPYFLKKHPFFHMFNFDPSRKVEKSLFCFFLNFPGKFRMFYTISIKRGTLLDMF